MDPIKARKMQVLFENEIREAREDAMQKGMQVGQRATLISVAQKLLKRGMSIADVVDSVVLEIEEVEHLSKK